MGRPKCAADGGLIRDVLNRATARLTIFEKGADYAAFEQVLQEAVDRTRMLAVDNGRVVLEADMNVGIPSPLA